LFAAVTLQVALGIVTLLWRAPLSLALAHQAMAMLVLTAAALHAANVTERVPRDRAVPARA
jgi:cytochrome c oxidase assembly protein subunit 15